MHFLKKYSNFREKSQKRGRNSRFQFEILSIAVIFLKGKQEYQKEACFVTAREINTLKERSRTRRRNLKRYMHTQSFNRLSNRPVVSGRVVSPLTVTRARGMLAVAASGLLGTGLYFVIF